MIVSVANYLWLSGRDLVSSSAKGGGGSEPLLGRRPRAPSGFSAPLGPVGSGEVVASGNSRDLLPTCRPLVASLGFAVERDREVRPAVAGQLGPGAELSRDQVRTVFSK